MKNSKPSLIPILLFILCATGLCANGGLCPAGAAIVSVTGTAIIETNPYPPEANATVFVFDEQQSVPFVASQTLDFGSIAPGTLVDSHYIQFDPVTSTGFVGTGSVTFDGPILGVITRTQNLEADLSPDVAATSDEYFGLATTLGPYPLGADPSARGLGSPEDDLLFTLGDPTLTIDSLEIPSGGGGNVDCVRVFTAAPTPVPALSGWMWALGALAMITFFARRRYRVAP